MTHAALASVQPLHVFAWIVDSGLKDSLKSLAHALLRRVDRHSWRWPRQRGARGGVTVAELADGAGLSRRHAARCLRDLEEMGLVRTTFRPFEVSEYALLPQAWKVLASRHQARRDARKAQHRSDRIARYQAWRDAQARRPAPVAPAVPVAEHRRVQPDALPHWAQQHSRRLGTPADTLFAVVGGAAAAILGEGIAPEAQGGLARPVLKLWDGRGRPDADALAEELALVASWARSSVHPDALRLRGLGPRGDGVDGTRDARRLCDPVVFSERLRLAEQHGQAVHSSPGERPPPARAADWVPPGLAPPPTPAVVVDPKAAWQRALESLRRTRPERARDLDAFVAPLMPDSYSDGVVWVSAPTADLAAWVVQWMMGDLQALADTLQCGIGFRAPRGH